MFRAIVLETWGCVMGEIALCHGNSSTVGRCVNAVTLHASRGTTSGHLSLPDDDEKRAKKESKKKERTLLCVS